MIKFTKDSSGLTDTQSYMYSDKVSPCPLIKVQDADITDDRWKSISDKEFYDFFCKDFHKQGITTLEEE